MIIFEFGYDLEESLFVRHADEHERRRRHVDALGERVGHFECGMVCLDDLLRQAEVLADKQKAVSFGIDLRHIQYPE